MASFLLENVRVAYGSVVALDLSRLEVPGGAITVLLGPNGSGKTTLLRVMAGLQATERGSVRCGGRPVSPGAGGLAHRRRATLLAQQPYLFHEKVIRNVTAGPRFRGAGRKEADAAARESLEAVGCAHLSERDGNALSGGERKRVALARALATGAEVLLLDEPEAGVDAESGEKLQEIVRRLAESGKTIVLSTHQPDWLDPLPTVRITLSYGKLASPPVGAGG